MIPARAKQELDALAPLGEVFQNNNTRLYLVGGRVRDLLLDRLKSLCTSQIKLDTPKATLNQVKVWLVKLLTKSDNSSIYATIVKCRP